VPDRDLYNPRNEVNPWASVNPPGQDVSQQVMDAAQTGQQELFDTSAVGALLNTTRDDELIDKYLKPIMDGLDAKGHLLLNSYWHDDQFSDRYGKRALPQLQDALRNAFEADGDLALTLKHKTIEADPTEAMRSPDLGDLAET